MIERLPLAAAGPALLMAGAGFAFGLLYFRTLRLSVTLFASGRGWLGPLALTAGRLGAALAFLAMAAKLGAAALLAAFAAFLLARALALRAARRAL
jgi:hypothetical protein